MWISNIFLTFLNLNNFFELYNYDVHQSVNTIVVKFEEFNLKFKSSFKAHALVYYRRIVSIYIVLYFTILYGSRK